MSFNSIYIDSDGDINISTNLEIRKNLIINEDLNFNNSTNVAYEIYPNILFYDLNCVGSTMEVGMYNITNNGNYTGDPISGNFFPIQNNIDIQPTIPIGIYLLNLNLTYNFLYSPSSQLNSYKITFSCSGNSLFANPSFINFISTLDEANSSNYDQIANGTVLLNVTSVLTTNEQPTFEILSLNTNNTILPYITSITTTPIMGTITRIA